MSGRGAGRGSRERWDVWQAEVQNRPRGRARPGKNDRSPAPPPIVSQTFKYIVENQPGYEACLPGSFPAARSGSVCRLNLSPRSSCVRTVPGTTKICAGICRFACSFSGPCQSFWSNATFSGAPRNGLAPERWESPMGGASTFGAPIRSLWRCPITGAFARSSCMAAGRCRTPTRPIRITKGKWPGIGVAGIATIPDAFRPIPLARPEQELASLDGA